jgi:protease I
MISSPDTPSPSKGLRELADIPHYGPTAVLKLKKNWKSVITRDMICLVAFCSNYTFWRIEKMKRLTIFIIIVTCFTMICFGQRRTRALVQKVIQLTAPNTTGKVPFETALSKERNVLAFNGQTIDRSIIGQLAWAGQGIREAQQGQQTLPPQEETPGIILYLATDEGLFVYQPADNSLQQTIYQDIRDALAAAVGPMGSSIAGAGCTFIITAPTRRLGPHTNNSRISAYIETGQIAQNIQLQAVCLDLASGTISNFEARNIITACRMPRNLEPLYLVCIGYPATVTTTETAGNQTVTRPKRAAIIVPPANFQDEELFETLRALKAASVETVIASTTIGIARGSLGRSVETSMLVNQLNVDDYDAIIFIGGVGSTGYVFDLAALNLIRQAVELRKIVAATSNAPTILANAGVLNGVKVTALFTEAPALQKVGAIYTGTPVEDDKKVITSRDPAAAALFARTVADAITGR